MKFIYFIFLIRKKNIYFVAAIAVIFNLFSGVLEPSNQQVRKQNKDGFFVLFFLQTF